MKKIKRRKTRTGRIVVDERCVAGNTFNFEQKNEIQEFKVPCSGTYKLETWGAQGGDALDLEGGYGGYSAGNINLKLRQKLYIVVGGEGETTLDFSNKESGYYERPNGGYNGGGIGTSGVYGKGYRYGSGGGGATHISLQIGLLSSLSNSINDIYIVSGGGGGASKMIRTELFGAYGPGGSAGGYIGNTGYYTLVNHTYEVYAQGGTQTEGGKNGNSYSGVSNQSEYGSFGAGGNRLGVATTNGSGGGSGYYGGGAGGFAPGAGGSSYIGNISLTNKAMYCYDCTESLDLTKPEIFTVSTTGNSNYKDTLNCPNGYDENPVSKCAKKGNGFARITLISKS